MREDLSQNRGGKKEKDTWKQKQRNAGPPVMETGPTSNAGLRLRGGKAKGAWWEGVRKKGHLSREAFRAGGDGGIGAGEKTKPHKEVNKFMTSTWKRGGGWPRTGGSAKEKRFVSS